TPPSPAVQGNQTTDMMRRMEACLTRLGARLIELERETGAASPDPKWGLEHTNAILRLLHEMSKMRGRSQASPEKHRALVQLRRDRFSKGGSLNSRVILCNANSEYQFNVR